MPVGEGQLARPIYGTITPRSLEAIMIDPNKRHFDLNKVNEVWEEYARTHDLSGKERLAAGIDPDTREVFLGNSAKDIVARLESEGKFRPLFYRWVNDPYYTRKGGRR
jgi:hypothetical protein